MRLVLVLAMVVLLNSVALAQQPVQTLAQLLSESYEIKAITVTGTIILQKGTSAFVCAVTSGNPGDPVAQQAQAVRAAPCASVSK
jgi:hypothetical protein